LLTRKQLNQGFLVVKLKSGKLQVKILESKIMYRSSEAIIPNSIQKIANFGEEISIPEG